MKSSILLLFGIFLLAIAMIAPAVSAAPKQCKAKVDLLFVVDKSGSILADAFIKEKQFLQEIIETFWVGPDHTKVSLLMYGKWVRNKFDFNKYSEVEMLKRDVAALECPQCGKSKTATGAALQYGATKSLTAERGDRSDVKNVVVVLTDGRSTEGADFWKKHAEFMKTKATVVAIGVGGFLKPELLVIASDESMVFTTNNFDNLAKLTGVVADKTCEVSVKCTKKIDLVFIVDTSKSLTRDTFKKQIQWVRDTTKQFVVGPDLTQVALVQFAHRVSTRFCFIAYHTNKAVDKRIEEISKRKFFRGSTATSAALKVVKDKLFTKSCGSRADAEKVAILITDGRPNFLDRAVKEANALKQTGVTLITVGVGKGLKSHDLDGLASSPEHAYHNQDFKKLDTITPDLLSDACSES